MLGIFDAGMELNEREPFWEGTLPTSLPIQLRKLGYETNYWYGGSLSHGNFNHFAPACGLIIPIPAPTSAAPKRLAPGSASMTTFF